MIVKKVFDIEDNRAMGKTWVSLATMVDGQVRYDSIDAVLLDDECTLEVEARAGQIVVFGRWGRGATVEEWYHVATDGQLVETTRENAFLAEQGTSEWQAERRRAYRESRKADINPLERYSDEALLAELKRRRIKA